MKKVSFLREFKYWRNGCWAEVYGPGEVEVDDEVFAAAKACGAVGEQRSPASEPSATAAKTPLEKSGKSKKG